MARPRTFEADSNMLKEARGFTLPEMGTPEFEIIPDDDKFSDTVALEAFMNEELLIIIPRSSVKGTLAVENPSLNGINMPIVRGVPTLVKRKYVEILAQSVAYDYSQVLRSPIDPSDIETVESRVHAYPFEVRKDPSGEKGYAWLERVMAMQ